MLVFYFTVLRSKFGNFAKNRTIVTIAASLVRVVQGGATPAPCCRLCSGRRATVYFSAHSDCEVISFRDDVSSAEVRHCDCSIITDGRDWFLTRQIHTVNYNTWREILDVQVLLEETSLLGYESISNGKSLSTFRNSLLPTSSGSNYTTWIRKLLQYSPEQRKSWWRNCIHARKSSLDLCYSISLTTCTKISR